MGEFLLLLHFLCLFKYDTNPNRRSRNYLFLLICVFWIIQQKSVLRTLHVYSSTVIRFRESKTYKHLVVFDTW